MARAECLPVVQDWSRRSTDRTHRKENPIFSRGNVKKKTYSFNINQEPINVYSAFGGFGIYKMENILNNKRSYEGTQTIDLKFKDNTTNKIKFQKCEHVNFNFGFIDQKCELYILPYLINREYLEVTFPPQAATKLIIKD